MYLFSIIAQELQNPVRPTDWMQYGALGMIVVFLVWYIINLTKQHREERKEWRQDTQQLIRDNIQTNKELTSAIQNLKGILETIQRREKL